MAVVAIANSKVVRFLFIGIRLLRLFTVCLFLGFCTPMSTSEGKGTKSFAYEQIIGTKKVRIQIIGRVEKEGEEG